MESKQEGPVITGLFCSGNLICTSNNNLLIICWLEQNLVDIVHKAYVYYK